MNKRNALLSVYDKAGIVEFAQSLVQQGWSLYSSGGTAKVLAAAEVPVTDVEELTGFPPILDHRVVTLAPKVHGGLLAVESIEEHVQQLEQYGIPYIDLACVDLYPLQEEVAKPEATRKSVIDQTDIGGPTMLRSGAKGRRIVICKSSQRTSVLEWLLAGQPNGEEFRNSMAAEAEALIADYCLTSARYTSDGRFDGMIGELVKVCDYGENRWQSPAGLYATDDDDPLAVPRFKVVDGRDPSFINWTDVDRLLQTTTHLAVGHAKNFGDIPLVAIAVKHGNACGAAVGTDPETILKQMVTGNPLAVFGAVMMTNFPITEELAEVISRHETDVRRLLDGVCAPNIAPGAYPILARKDGKYALLTNPALGDLKIQSLDPKPLLRPVRGGFLKQPNYTHILYRGDWVSSGELTLSKMRDVVTGWAVCSTSNSNTVTLVKNGQVIGNGAGQQDRKRCCELAVKQAIDSGHEVEGAAAASDSFFPFPDGPEVLIDAGVKTIFSTSGSRNDDATQQLCAERGVVLVQQPDAEARSFYRH